MTKLLSLRLLPSLGGPGGGGVGCAGAEGLSQSTWFIISPSIVVGMDLRWCISGGDGGDGSDGGDGGDGGGRALRRVTGAEGALRTAGSWDGIGSDGYSIANLKSSPSPSTAEDIIGGAGGGGVLPLSATVLFTIRFLVIRFPLKSSSGPPGVMTLPGVCTCDDVESGVLDGGGVFAIERMSFLLALPFFLLFLFMVTWLILADNASSGSVREGSAGS